ncbi:MAG: bifunctional precorrin-2 dehydrogenase/sirohydrochlorin ferrochelatase [Firmicutes bacterium]|nr:bifunctional precorrin-2 dehydrogenase/sirohydrochlorin ferrochelatase [Bacillota bacterium]
MAYFPILIDWDGLPCLVAGGGRLALHKAALLTEQGAVVTVVAPEICEEILALPVTPVLRRVTGEDAAGKALVIDATGDSEAQKLLSDACRRQNVPFNSACKVDDGTAIFPAVHRQGRTVVAVSSLGASPAASAKLRDKLANEVPAEMDAILDCMADLRPLSREWFSEQPERREFLHRCLDAMLASGRPLNEETVREIRNSIRSMCIQREEKEKTHG